MDKLSSLHAFVAVVETGGFSSAARRLGVSKAQVSKQVAQLEELLGVRLLHRTTRRVTATSSGQAYFEQCQPLLTELDELDSVVQNKNASPSGELRITAPISFAELRLMPVVAGYSERYPEVQLNLNLTDKFVDLIEERVDVAIRIGSLEDSSLVASKLGTTSMQVCATPAYLASNGMPTDPAQLSHHDCVVDSNYPGKADWLLGSGDRAMTVKVSSKMQVNSARAARELVLANRGIGYLPSFAINDDIKAGRLKHLFQEYATAPLGIYAVYTHRRHLSAKVRLLIEMIKNHENE